MLPFRAWAAAPALYRLLFRTFSLRSSDKPGLPLLPDSVWIRYLLHHRLHDLRILRYTSHISHGNFQVSGHDCIQLVEQYLAFLDITYPVGHHHHLREILLESRMSVQCLQQRIGIRDGSRLRCGHQQHFPAGHQKFQHTVRDSRSGIHDNDIRQASSSARFCMIQVRASFPRLAIPAIPEPPEINPTSIGPQVMISLMLLPS